MNNNDVECIKSNISSATAMLKAMSNERRLLILCALSDGEKCVGELEKVIGISQSALSQHLAKLRDEKLVITKRNAQSIYYNINNPAVTELMHSLIRIYK